MEIREIEQLRSRALDRLAHCDQNDPILIPWIEIVEATRIDEFFLASLRKRFPEISFLPP